MIIKTRPNKNIYGRFFLATEAPDDEDTEVTGDQPKPRRNVKVVSVKPSNRGKDFTQVGNDPITTDTAEIDDDVDIDETDYTSDDTDANNAETQTEDTPTNDETEGSEDQEQDDGTDDAPDTGEDDNTDFADADDGGDQPADEATGEDGPDIDGDEDFTADSDTSGTDDTASSDSGTTDTTNQIGAAGVDLDSMRKYKLYREYMSLYNACDNYVSKLEVILKNDRVTNQIIQTAVTNLREIKTILSDYMTIRFQVNTYVQSLLFYQKMVVAVQLVFKLLKSIEAPSKKV